MRPPYRILGPLRPDGGFAGACALAIMAKAPVPGKVKTRLSPPLTAQQAADLNACFLRDTVENLTDAANAVAAKVVISYTPAGAEEAFTGILPEDALLLSQRGDSFGERLLYTAADLFACGFAAVCLIDSDSPTVPTAEFARAAETLLRPGNRAVLGPSSDGGYYLLGLQSAQAHLFERIDWSTDVVVEQTLERAREIGLPMVQLAEWYDVDDAISLERLCAELGGEARSERRGYAAPHTRKFLRTLVRLTCEDDPIESFA